MNPLRLLLTSVLLGLFALTSLGSVGTAVANPGFSTQTGRDCSYCHTTPGGPLTAEGERFKQGGPQPATSAAGPPSTRPVLFLPGWLWATLIWLHVAAIFAWLAGVHINTPRTDRLSWPALVVVGVTGVLLTLAKVGEAHYLVSARSGILLLVKMVLSGILIALATLAVFFVQPRLAAEAKNEPRRMRSQEHFKAQGRITVMHRGKVYDVTGSRLWPEGRHARRHDAWQDLTGALAGAPHGAEVLERFTLVEDAGKDRVPTLVSVYSGIRYASFALVLVILLIVVFM
jgi:predicted heme/steroid binding protein